MATDKLYWKDPFATSFEESRWRVGSYQGRTSVVLPRTLFYPEGGGQLGDIGTLELGDASVAVTDTQVDDDGLIHHITELPPPPSSEGNVRGSIDGGRRVDHMVQHTAQHMLSCAFASVARADTASARLGRTACTIDLDVPDARDAALAKAEDLVNAVIRDDVEVRALFPTERELREMKLRRAPKVSAGVRVIEVSGFDQTPCGGTHCTRTGQIGFVRVAGTERYKGKVRVTFHAGARAVADVRSNDRVLAVLAQTLTCGAADLPPALAKLKAELDGTRESLGKARAELARMVAERALEALPPKLDGSETRIVVVREHDDVATLRVLAEQLTARPDVVAICLSREPRDALSVVVQRGTASTFDCAAWLKRVATEHGGRGGGRPERAEGRLALDAETSPHLRAIPPASS